MWAAGAAAAIRPAQLPGTTPGLVAPVLPVMTPAEETVADLWATGVFGTHPLRHIRPLLEDQGVATMAALATAPAGGTVVVGGLVTHRQRPPTAGGVVFLSLEDETGMANVICPPQVWERYRRVGAESGALLVSGPVERPPRVPPTWSLPGCGGCGSPPHRPAGTSAGHPPGGAVHLSGGGQISFATRRVAKDGSMLDVRIRRATAAGSAASA